VPQLGFESIPSLEYEPVNILYAADCRSASDGVAELAERNELLQQVSTQRATCNEYLH
jgi:hypothetical protein